MALTIKKHYDIIWNNAIWGTRWDIIDSKIFESDYSIKIYYHTSISSNTKWVEFFCDYISTLIFFNTKKQLNLINVVHRFWELPGLSQGGILEWSYEKGLNVKCYDSSIEYARLHDADLYKCILELYPGIENNEVLGKVNKSLLNNCHERCLGPKADEVFIEERDAMLEYDFYDNLKNGSPYINDDLWELYLVNEFRNNSGARYSPFEFHYDDFARFIHAILCTETKEFLTIDMVFGNLMVSRINNSYFNFYTVYDTSLVDGRTNHLELGRSTDPNVALNIIGNYLKFAKQVEFI